MDFDWNGIRYFAALVEKETLTAAAEYLDVRHSTVSRQVAQLENALGLRLFDRIGKRYLLTADGERLYRHACELCKDMDVLRRTAREQREMRHSVTVSAPSFVVRFLLMPHLADFCRTHRHIRLILQSEAAVADLHGRQADIALRLVRPVQNDLAVRRLTGFSFRLYAGGAYLKTTHRQDWQFVQFEETYSGDSHLGTYIGGVWFPDKTRVGWWKNGYPKYFGKAINALNYSKVAIYIDGQEVDLGKHAPTDFVLELDMHSGVLHRQFTLFGVQFRISKFLSVAQKERFVAGVIAAITPTG